MKMDFIRTCGGLTEPGDREFFEENPERRYRLRPAQARDGVMSTTDHVVILKKISPKTYSACAMYYSPAIHGEALAQLCEDDLEALFALARPRIDDEARMVELSDDSVHALAGALSKVTCSANMEQ